MLQRWSASSWAVLAVALFAVSVSRANAQTYSSGIISAGVPVNPMPPNAPVLVCNPDVSAPSNIDGTCNNLQCPLCGIRQTPFRRFLPDAVYVPFDPFRQPNERFISNVAHQIGKEEDGQKDERNIGDFTYQFGQFVNHDMQDANNPGPNPVAANIVVPKDDDGNMTGVVFFNRAATTAPDKLGRRFPLNGETTQYLDASVVYGSTVDVGNALRTFKFGLLATQQRNGTIPKDGPGKNHVPPPSNDPNDPLLSFPPFQTRDFIFMGNPNNRDPTTLIIAGDSRANEQAGLLAQHVLWMRNHNFWARRFAAVNPFWSDEQLFQAARRMNRAEFQKISFYDLVRVTLGKKAFARLGPYPGYNPNVGVESTDAMVCAGMRHGHSMVGLFLERNFFRFDPLTGQQQFDQDNFGRVSDSFFVPEIVLDTVDGIDSWMLGSARSSSSRVDHSMVDPLRNMLFPGFHNDLIAIDNRRCRDFGLSSWVVARRSLGLDVPKDFNDLKKFVQRDRDVNNLKLLYRRVEDIDLFTGGVIEKHADGSSISATFIEFWIDRFRRVREGDRFWFENPGVFDSDPKVDAALRALVWKSTIKTVILRNTRLRRESLEVGQDDLFFGPFPPQRDPAAQRDNNDPFQVDLFPPNNQRQAAGDLIPDDEDDEDGTIQS